MLHRQWENPIATQASTCAPTGTVRQGTRSPSPARGQKHRFPLEEELTLPNYPRRKHNTRSHPWWVLQPVHAPPTEHADNTATKPPSSTSDAHSPSLGSLQPETTCNTRTSHLELDGMPSVRLATSHSKHALSFQSGLSFLRRQQQMRSPPRHCRRITTR